jgi:hypothetical protein
MATQTPRQRSAAARKAAATRKRNASRRSASATRSAARRTARGAGRTTARRADAASTRLGAFGREVERALLIPVGATLTARDAIADAVTTRSRFRRQLARFERRGATAVRRNRQIVERRARGARSEANDIVGRVQQRFNGGR